MQLYIERIASNLISFTSTSTNYLIWFVRIGLCYRANLNAIMRHLQREKCIGKQTCL